MNLRSIANSATSAVNPNIRVTIKQSTGYSTDDSGKQVPQYKTITGVSGQKQSLSAGDIRRLESLNIQGVQEKMYFQRNYEAIFRATGKGGDLVIFGGHTYLVSSVLERWSGWCTVALTMQVD